jgi:hypothetical protein
MTMDKYLKTMLEDTKWKDMEEEKGVGVVSEARMLWTKLHGYSELDGHGNLQAEI